MKIHIGDDEYTLGRLCLAILKWVSIGFVCAGMGLIGFIIVIFGMNYCYHFLVWLG